MNPISVFLIPSPAKNRLASSSICRSGLSCLKDSRRETIFSATS